MDKDEAITEIKKAFAKILIHYVEEDSVEYQEFIDCKNIIYKNLKKLRKPGVCRWRFIQNTCHGMEWGIECQKGRYTLKDDKGIYCKFCGNKIKIVEGEDG